ncbi:MAG: hypothetical protein WAO35_06050 [Terriglobia bacterium]
MAQAMRKSDVVTHLTKKAGIPKKVHHTAADLSEPKTVVKFKASRNSAAPSKKRIASADADEVFGTLAKVFSSM